MQSSARAICELVADRHYLGAEPGILAVLHTWNTQLLLHPHVHMLVTGGGVCDGDWREVPSAEYLVPVEKLSPLISRRFSQTLQKEHQELHAQSPAGVWNREWCSFCKPFGYGHEAVLNYLARYAFHHQRKHRLDGREHRYIATQRQRHPKMEDHQAFWRRVFAALPAAYSAAGFSQDSLLRPLEFDQTRAADAGTTDVSAKTGCRC